MCIYVSDTRMPVNLKSPHTNAASKKHVHVHPLCFSFGGRVNI